MSVLDENGRAQFGKKMLTPRTPCELWNAPSVCL